MATAAVDKDEDVLRCTVCLDSYTDPCTLQCKHSFCRRCITDYVKTQADAVQAKTIPCPFCRQVTQLPDPSRPVDEWAGQLQAGHVIQELMATVNKEVVEDVTPCTPCQQLGETSQAKFWCENCGEAYCQRCARTHSGMAVSRDHDLCDIKDKSQLTGCNIKCKEHKYKLLELYCKNCNVMHCQLCFVDKHKKCEEVVTIESFVSDMKMELSDLKSQLGMKEKKSNALVEEHNTRISKLNTDKISVVEDILGASQTIIDLIKKKEKEMIDQVEEITDRESDELRAKVKIGNIKMQTYRQYSEYIKQAVSSNNDVKVCGVYQVWQSGQLDISQGGEKGRGEGNILSVRLSTDRQNVTQVLASLRFGEIVATYLPADVKSSPVLSESVDARMQEDKEDPLLYDITILEVGGLNTTIVTDTNNNCVKSFYTRNNKKCQNRLQLDNQPQGITQLGVTNVMVAVPDSKQIVTMTPDLIQVNVINTGKKYSTLSVISSSNLAAGGWNYVDILNMKGEVMKTVTTHNNKDLFRYSDFMCVSNLSDHLLVTDFGKETVTCLTPEGLVVWIYSLDNEDNTRYFPRGINTTNEGDILVADKTMKKIIQLSEAGEYVRDILISQVDLGAPRGICLDNQGTLYICDREKILKFVFVRK